MGDCVCCVHEEGQGDIRVARVQQAGFPLTCLFPSAQLYVGQDELSSLCRIYFAV